MCDLNTKIPGTNGSMIRVEKDYIVINPEFFRLPREPLKDPNELFNNECDKDVEVVTKFLVKNNKLLE